MKRFAYLMIALAVSGEACGKEIIALDQGLTLAEIRTPELQTLLIIEDRNNSVAAINISELTASNRGIVDSFQALGYTGIEQLASNASATIRQYNYEELLTPAGTGTHHIALGFNYPEHAAEVKQEDQPFIFLKTIAATREAPLRLEAEVLLDYEVEICARPMQAIAHNQDLETAHLGFFLCGDFTDRAALLRQIDLDNMRSGRGFSYAKSKPGYFPTGPYLVIPKNRQHFLQDLSFALKVNGSEKQRAKASEASWSLAKIGQEIILADQTKRPTYTVKTKRWLPNQSITADMTILTGTPEGVLMQPPSLWFKIISGSRYFFSGAFLHSDATEYVMERFIEKMHHEKVFLQAGDHVRFEARYLGKIDIKIID